MIYYNLKHEKNKASSPFIFGKYNFRAKLHETVPFGIEKKFLICYNAQDK